MRVSNVYYSIDSQGIHPEVEGNVLDAAIDYCLACEPSLARTFRGSTTLVILPAKHLAIARRSLTEKCIRIQNDKKVLASLSESLVTFECSRPSLKLIGSHEPVRGIFLEKCFISADADVSEENIMAYVAMIKPQIS
jgi:hypothetical protein